MKNMLTRKNIVSVMSLFLIACLFYAKQITDVLANPDAIWNGVLYKSDWRWETSLNRFVIKWLQDLKFHVVNTSVASIACLFLLCIGAVLITEILDVSSLIYKLVIGLLILFSVNTGCLLTYYYCSDLYALSFLCIVGAAYFTLKKDSIRTEIVSILLIVVALGIYQAYIVSLFTLLLLHLFQDALDLEWKVIHKKIIRSIRIVVLGLLGYLIASKLALVAYQVTAESSRGFSAMGILGLRSTINRTKETYYFFFQYYFGTVMINNDVGGRRFIHVVYFILLLALLLLCIGRIKEAWRRAVVGIMMVLFPVCIMCIHVMAPEASILDVTGPLMLPAMSYTYILGVLIVDHLDLKYLPSVLLVTEGMVLYAGISFNLAGQTYLEYSNKKAENVAEEIATSVEAVVDSSKEYKLCIVGTIEGGNYGDDLAELKENLKWTTYSYGAVWPDYNGSQGCWGEILKRTSGRSYRSCSNEEYALLKENGILDDMMVFPDNGSIKVTENNMIIVKLGNDIQ